MLPHLLHQLALAASPVVRSCPTEVSSSMLPTGLPILTAASILSGGKLDEGASVDHSVHALFWRMEVARLEGKKVAINGALALAQQCYADALGQAVVPVPSGGPLVKCVKVEVVQGKGKGKGKARANMVDDVIHVDEAAVAEALAEGDSTDK
jgi:hypothetical protein